MGMIRLKNVAKYYYNKGIIASGISGINLDLDVGEFVVITGESGSGKSTLLNVISGLDTYEEGEMYIEGRETSHYTPADFERYRQRYISVIFQNFNLISSYTVYQNIALAMQIDGCSNEEIKKRVNEIIEKVGLEDQKRQKVSKLSGGQKQRVAIARALAKDTDVLVADEPTGNLDSASAEGIVKLLAEIAADKLVVVVTHSFDQFKDHATRVIKMHDGRIVEDTGAARKEAASDEYAAEKRKARRKKETRSMSYGTQLALGIRNTFNLPAKFLLLLLVFLFVTASVSAQYVSVKKNQDTVSQEGYNEYFSNYSPKRVVVERADRQAFTKADFEAIANAPHVQRLIRDDIMYDSTAYVESDTFNFGGYILSIQNIEKDLDYGNMPQAGNEVVLEGTDDIWGLGDDPEALIGQTFKCASDDDDGAGYEVVVSGVIITDSNNDYGRIYFTDSMMTELRRGLYAAASRTYMLINREEESVSVGEGGLVTNEKVPEGYILLPTSYDTRFKKGYAAGNEVRLRTKTLYYDAALNLMIMGTYGEKTFKKKTGLSDFAEHDGEIYINPTDYRRLYEKGSFQTTVIVDDARNTDGMKDMLERGGYHVLVLKDHIFNYLNGEIVDVIQLPVAIIVSLAVFFIAYFVIRLILKSRGVYFATVRMLGMNKESAQRIMRVELVLVCMIAYLIFVLAIFIGRSGMIDSEQLRDYLTYLTPRDYILLAIILLAMAVIISSRYMKSIFRSSAMGTYREEA